MKTAKTAVVGLLLVSFVALAFESLTLEVRRLLPNQLGYTTSTAPGVDRDLAALTAWAELTTVQQKRAQHGLPVVVVFYDGLPILYLANAYGSVGLSEIVASAVSPGPASYSHAPGGTAGTYEISGHWTVGSVYVNGELVSTTWMFNVTSISFKPPPPPTIDVY